MADPCGMCSFGGVGVAPSPTPEQQQDKEDRDLEVISSSMTEGVNNCQPKQQSAEEDPSSSPSLALIQEADEDTPAVVDKEEEESEETEEEPEMKDEEEVEDVEEEEQEDKVPAIQDSTSDKAEAVETLVAKVQVPVEEVKDPECNFDVNPTELYLAMQKKEWDTAMDYIEEDPTQVCCWVYRREKDGRLRWRLLPIHAALIFQAPTRIIAALLYAHPASAAAQDDQGMVPLHLAFKMQQESDVVGHLLAACPDAVNHKDRKGRTPRALAEASTSNPAKRDAFLKALERGPIRPTPVTIAGVEQASVLLASPRIDYSKKIMEMQRQHKEEIESLQEERASKEWVFKSQITQLEEELQKTQQASEILVDHVASLEDQLESRTETEKFLATKIVNLDMELANIKADKKKLEEGSEEELTREQTDKFQIQTRLTMVQQELAEAKTLHQVQVASLLAQIQEQAAKIEELQGHTHAPPLPQPAQEEAPKEETDFKDEATHTDEPTVESSAEAPVETQEQVENEDEPSTAVEEKEVTETILAVPAETEESVEKDEESSPLAEDTVVPEDVKSVLDDLKSFEEEGVGGAKEEEKKEDEEVVVA